MAKRLNENPYRGVEISSQEKNRLIDKEISRRKSAGDKEISRESIRRTINRYITTSGQQRKPPKTFVKEIKSVFKESRVKPVSTSPSKPGKNDIWKWRTKEPRDSDTGLVKYTDHKRIYTSAKDAIDAANSSIKEGGANGLELRSVKIEYRPPGKYKVRRQIKKRGESKYEWATYTKHTYWLSYEYEGGSQ